MGGLHITKKDIQGFKEFVKDKSQGNSLENKVISSIFIAFGVSGLFFATPSLTGNFLGGKAIASNFIGLIIFVIGVFGFYFHLKSSKQ